jgi:hypothetical protein
MEFMMKHGFFMLCAFVLLVMAGCPDPLNDNGGSTPGQDDPGGSVYAETYWGEWIRMDASETWYISGGKIKIDGRESSKSVSLEKQSDRVIQVTEGGRKYYLYASRTANASFTGTIAAFDSVSPPIRRSVAGGKGWAKVVTENLNNGSTQTIQTDDEGKFTVEDAIPGDEYRITPEGGTPVTVTPKGDGDDVGTITVSNGVNFKVGIVGMYLGTSYNNESIDTDLNMLCADGWYESPYYGSYVYSSQPTYPFGLSIRNTGSIDVTAATYMLSFDEGLELTKGNYSGILGTIEPGTSKVININLRCSSGSIVGDYAWKKINITINDPINNRTWNDSVSLRFFKKIASVRFTGSANGIIITPSGQTVRSNSVMSADYGNIRFTGAAIPKLTGNEYLFVFSGAVADSESVYSFSFIKISYSGTIPDMPDQDGSLETDTARYEPNNTEDTATVITGGIHAYLHKNDIDYYKFHF